MYQYVEEDIELKKALRVWVAFFWRSLLAMFFFRGLIGAINFLLGNFATPLPTSISVIVGVSLLIVGIILCSIVPFWLILGKNFGKFRLVLLSNDPIEVPANEPQTDVREY